MLTLKEVLSSSVIILLCRKASHLVVIISMRLKIDQVMLRDSIDLLDTDYLVRMGFRI